MCPQRFQRVPFSSVHTCTRKQRFQNVPLWRAFLRSSVFIDRFHRYVWTKVVSVKKKLRFQLKTDTCGQGLNLVNQKLLKVERGLHVKMLDSAPFTVRP